MANSSKDDIQRALDALMKIDDGAEYESGTLLTSLNVPNFIAGDSFSNQYLEFNCPEPSEMRYCKLEGCKEIATNRSLYCGEHIGARRCEEEGCHKCAQGSTKYCIAHGGGRRCTFPGCVKGARDKKFCACHGGGKRCSIDQCGKSAVGGSVFCTAHGGGRKCQVEGCTKSSQSPKNFCVRHGGGKKCQVIHCTKAARGRTLFCAGHGGGIRCSISDCTRAVVAKHNVCRIHLSNSDVDESDASMRTGLQHHSMQFQDNFVPYEDPTDVEWRGYGSATSSQSSANDRMPFNEIPSSSRSKQSLASSATVGDRAALFDGAYGRIQCGDNEGKYNDWEAMNGSSQKRVHQIGEQTGVPRGARGAMGGESTVIGVTDALYTNYSMRGLSLLVAQSDLAALQTPAQFHERGSTRMSATAAADSTRAQASNQGDNETVNVNATANSGINHAEEFRRVTPEGSSHSDAEDEEHKVASATIDQSDQNKRKRDQDYFMTDSAAADIIRKVKNSRREEGKVDEEEQDQPNDIVGGVRLMLQVGMPLDALALCYQCVKADDSNTVSGPESVDADDVNPSESCVRGVESAAVLDSVSGLSGKDATESGSSAQDTFTARAEVALSSVEMAGGGRLQETRSVHLSARSVHEPMTIDQDVQHLSGEQAAAVSKRSDDAELKSRGEEVSRIAEKVDGSGGREGEDKGDDREDATDLGNIFDANDAADASAAFMTAIQQLQSAAAEVAEAAEADAEAAAKAAAAAAASTAASEKNGGTTASGGKRRKTKKQIAAEAMIDAAGNITGEETYVDASFRHFPVPAHKDSATAMVVNAIAAAKTPTVSAPFAPSSVRTDPNNPPFTPGIAGRGSEDSTTTTTVGGDGDETADGAAVASIANIVALAAALSGRGDSAKALGLAALGMTGRATMEGKAQAASQQGARKRKGSSSSVARKEQSAGAETSVPAASLTSAEFHSDPSERLGLAGIAAGAGGAAAACPRVGTEGGGGGGGAPGPSQGINSASIALSSDHPRARTEEFRRPPDATQDYGPNGATSASYGTGMAIGNARGLDDFAGASYSRPQSRPQAQPSSATVPGARLEQTTRSYSLSRQATPDLQQAASSSTNGVGLLPSISSSGYSLSRHASPEPGRHANLAYTGQFNGVSSHNDPSHPLSGPALLSALSVPASAPMGVRTVVGAKGRAGARARVGVDLAKPSRGSAGAGGPTVASGRAQVPVMSESIAIGGGGSGGGSGSSSSSSTKGACSSQHPASVIEATHQQKRLSSVLPLPQSSVPLAGLVSSDSGGSPRGNGALNTLSSLSALRGDAASAKTRINASGGSSSGSSSSSSSSSSLPANSNNTNTSADRVVETGGDKKASSNRGATVAATSSAAFGKSRPTAAAAAAAASGGATGMTGAASSGRGAHASHMDSTAMPLTGGLGGLGRSGSSNEANGWSSSHSIPGVYGSYGSTPVYNPATGMGGGGGGGGVGGGGGGGGGGYSLPQQYHRYNSSLPYSGDSGYPISYSPYSTASSGGDIYPASSGYSFGAFPSFGGYPPTPYQQTMPMLDPYLPQQHSSQQHVRQQQQQQRSVSAGISGRNMAGIRYSLSADGSIVASGGSNVPSPQGSFNPANYTNFDTGPSPALSSHMQQSSYGSISGGGGNPLMGSSLDAMQRRPREIVTINGRKAIVLSSRVTGGVGGGSGTVGRVLGGSGVGGGLGSSLAVSEVIPLDSLGEADVILMLEALHLGKYKQAFADNGFNGIKLQYVEANSDLAEFGISLPNVDFRVFQAALKGFKQFGVPRSMIRAQAKSQAQSQALSAGSDSNQQQQQQQQSALADNSAGTAAEAAGPDDIGTAAAALVASAASATSTNPIPVPVNNLHSACAQNTEDQGSGLQLRENGSAGSGSETGMVPRVRSFAQDELEVASLFPLLQASATGTAISTSAEN